jgi:hypothetical protein
VPIRNSASTFGFVLHQQEDVMTDSKKPAGKGPKDGAKGQFVGTQHGGSNDGTVSANPKEISGRDDGDATFPVKKGK